MAGGMDGKEANDTKPAPVTYQFAIKPEEKPGWEGFKEFLWNSEKSEFLGRTASSWLKISVFYIIYYASLAGFFITMLAVFYQTLDKQVPKWQNTNGIIGDNPGMGFRPKPDPKYIESTLVSFRHGSSGNWKPWVKRLDDYVTGYKKVADNKSPDLVECRFGGDMKPGEGQICKVSAEALFTDQCQQKNAYGFDSGTPCILLKLNKIYGWLPKTYKNSSMLPDDAPKSLKDKAKELEEKDPLMAGQMVWLSCEGENPADKEHIGEVEFSPYPGFPSYYFPFMNQDGYLSPAVFANLKNPKKGVLIAIECKAWAENVEHSSKDRTGSVHFELLID